MFAFLEFVSNPYIVHTSSVCVFYTYISELFSMSIFFPDKVLVAGQQIASGISIMATVNMAPMSPKTSWISLTIPHKRPNDNHFLKVCQNPPLTLHILVLQLLLVDLVPQEAHTNRAKLHLLVEKGLSQVCPAWRS